MKWLRSLLSLFALTAAISIAGAPAGAQPVPAFKYARGYVRPKNIDDLKKASALRQNLAARVMVPATEKQWDSRKLGWVGPVFNQGACGSCWCCAGTRAVEIANNKAGTGKADTFKLSEQYTLDCVQGHGGCNGDDHSTVFNWAKKHGLPLTKDYGPYHASEGRCKSNDSMQFFKSDGWEYCDPSARGVASTQSIKDGIKNHGAVSVAVAAGRGWDNYNGGVHVGGNTGINHEVVLVGWKDDASVNNGGYWILNNSWGTGWGDGGYMNIAYGSDGVGTDAAYAIVDAPEPPPVPPEPPPPGPGPKPDHNTLATVVILLVVLLLGLAAGFFLGRAKK